MSINYNTQTTSTNNLGNNVTPELKAYYDRQMIRFCQPKNWFMDSSDRTSLSQRVQERLLNSADSARCLKRSNL